jgi:hypothetical protein
MGGIMRFLDEVENRVATIQRETATVSGRLQDRGARWASGFARFASERRGRLLALLQPMQRRLALEHGEHRRPACPAAGDGAALATRGRSARR